MQQGAQRLAGAAMAVAVTLAVPALAHGEAKPTGKLLGDATARTIEVVPCNPGSGGLANDQCPPGGAYLLGELPLTVTGGPVGVSFSWVPDDGSPPVDVPGSAKDVAVAGVATVPKGIAATALGRLSGSFQGGLRQRVQRVLVALSQLASGRTPVARRVAQSPQFQTAVANALRTGADNLTHAQLKLLGRRFGSLISPRGLTAAPTPAETLPLIKAIDALVRPNAGPGALPIAPAAAKKAVGTAFHLVSRSRVLVPAGKTRTLPLRFALPPGKPIASLNGTLVVYVAGVGSPLAITAKVQELSPIAVEPSTVVIEHSTASVDLVGPGVRELLAHPDASPPSVRLRSGDHEVTATLKLPATHAVDDPDRATATVALSGDPYPGKYAGDLPIRSVLPSKPTVGVEVRAHRSIWLAFLLIFLGAVIGGLFARFAALARRRELLREALEESLDKYTPLEAGGQGWSMSALLGPGPPWEADTSELQGVRGLFRSIGRARSSGDLDDDTARVLDMVARLQRWLRLEPAIRRLRLVQVEIPEGAGWTATYAWRATEELLAAARREPPNAEAADALVARILRHATWHHRFAVAWSAASNYQERDRLKALDEANVETHALEVTPEQQDTLDIQVRTLLAAFGAPAAAITNMPVPPGEPVVWDASPNQFTGWATLDGKSYGQLVHEARAGSRAYNPLTLSKEISKLGLLDLLASLAAVAVASLIYLPTVYDDTWGSLDDILTAITAGVLGLVAVKWAALPAFQSLRLRAAAQ